jgi:hypothetical protein
MAFKRVDKSAVGGWRTDNDTPTVRMSCYLQDDKQPRSVAFYINQVLIDLLGWKLQSDAKGRKSLHIDVHEGTGDDAGFMMLAEGDQRGYVMAASKAGSYTFSLNISFIRFRHYVINEVPTPLGDVEFTYDVNDKTVLVQCPDWLRYNPLSVPAEPPKLEAPKPEVPPTKAAKSGKADDVKGMLKEIAKDTALNRKDRRAVVAAVARRM